MTSTDSTPGPDPAPFISCVTAQNPSPMTLAGTNTYLIGAPGSESLTLVDPGPAETAEAHLDAVRTAAQGRRIELILLTHRHEDHAGAVELFHEATGAPVRAHLPELCRAATPLTDGERLVVADTVILALHTPGHTSDSCCFQVPSAGSDGAILTGDTILGSGTSMLDHPDGRLVDYLASLARLRAEGDATVLPGHGPALDSVAQAADEYLEHRRARVRQVREALADLGDDAAHVTAARLAERIYPDVDERVAAVAEMTVAAHLDYVRSSTS